MLVVARDGQCSRAAQDHLTLAEEAGLAILAIDGGGVGWGIGQCTDRTLGQIDVEALVALVVDGGRCRTRERQVVERDDALVVAVELDGAIGRGATQDVVDDRVGRAGDGDVGGIGHNLNPFGTARDGDTGAVPRDADGIVDGEIGDTVDVGIVVADGFVGR